MNELTSKPDQKPTDGNAFYGYMQKEVKHAIKALKDFHMCAAAAVRRYRDERSEKDKEKVKFNILFSNTQTINAATFNQTPTPDVRRRYRDDNNLAAQGSEILERALKYSIDSYNFKGILKKINFDANLPGMGVPRVRYEAVTEPIVNKVLVGAAVAAEGEPAPELAEGEYIEDGMIYRDDQGEQIVYQDVYCEHVNWRDFLWSPAKDWQSVRWIAFRHTMSRDEMVDEFGQEKGGAVPLDKSRKGSEGAGDDKKVNSGENVDEFFNLAEVWELWDKETGKVYFLNLQYMGGFLKVEDDPLNLEGFFCTPEPLVPIATTGEFCPIPEYDMYKDQVQELDDLTQRMSKLMSSIKAVGVYDASRGDLKQVLKGSDGEMYPVDLAENLVDSPDLTKAYSMLDPSPYAQVYIQLSQERERVKQTIYEVTGISDIIRGSSKASETATAQRIKGQFGTMRLQDRQADVQRIARDLMRLKAEIIAEHFEPEQLQLMTGMEVTPDVMMLLRSDVLRQYNIDIETDSTIAADEAEEQENSVKLIQAVLQYIKEVAPMVQSGLLPLEAAKDILMATVASFKGSRKYEQALDQLGSNFQQQQQGGLNGAVQAGGQPPIPQAGAVPPPSVPAGIPTQ